jgi:hypothetical protein
MLLILDSRKTIYTEEKEEENEMRFDSGDPVEEKLRSAGNFRCENKKRVNEKKRSFTCTMSGGGIHQPSMHISSRSLSTHHQRQKGGEKDEKAFASCSQRTSGILCALRWHRRDIDD